MSVEPGTQRGRSFARAGGRTPFVGREDERATLRRLLQDAAEGSAGLAMIGGEPGVGKTRLAEEVAAEARERGFLTVTGHCYDMEGGLPYQPFVEALEYLPRVVPPTDLSQWLGDDGSELARLAPELRRLFPDLPATTQVPPEEGRRLLLGAWSGFLERAARTQPMLLILDDVHWADESSLLLLQHLARRLAEKPVLVLCTYRDAELDVNRPLAATLQELVRQRTAHDIVLRRLPEQDVAVMVEARGPGAPPAELVALVYGETDGNPFFVEEVLRHLSEEGKLLDPAGDWASGVAIGEVEVPRSVRLVIQQRLARLSESCRQLLASAAVVGREFSFEVLRGFGDLESEGLIEAIEEAERASLLRDSSRGREARYSFSHELFRQALLGGLSMPRRLRLHLRVAETMERVYDSALDSHLAELAFHYRQAGAVADAEKSIDYSLRAGAAAAGVFAWREAISHYEGALHALENAKTPDPRRRCQLLLSLAEALLFVPDARRVYEVVAPEAYDLAMSLGANELAARAAWGAVRGLDMQLTSLAFGRPDYREWAERLDRLATDGTVNRIHAELAMAKLTVIHGGLDESMERCLRALALARATGAGDGVILTVFLTMASYCDGPRFDVRRRQLAAEVASSLAVLPRGVSLPLAEACLRLIAGEALGRGDRDGACRAVELMFAFKRQRPMELGTGQAEYYRDGLFRYMDGELDSALATSDEVGAGILSGKVPLWVGLLAWNLGVRPRYYLGRSPNDLPFMKLEDLPLQPPRALYLAAFGRPDKARSVLLRRRDDAPAGAAGAPDSTPLWALVLFMEAATLIGDAELTAWFAAPLWDCGSVTTGWMYTTMVNRHLGAAAALLGEPERARSYYERALAEAAAMQFRPEVALTRLGLAELLVDHFGKTDEPREHVGIAIPEFEAMGMAPSLARAQALQERLESAPAPHPSLPGGLSEREAEVLRLIAIGKTNGEIAEVLVISPHTVGRHVSNIFDKLGITHRADAAAWAVRSGLVE